jgi:hypothetical protein
MIYFDEEALRKQKLESACSQCESTKCLGRDENDDCLTWVLYKEREEELNS